MNLPGTTLRSCTGWRLRTATLLATIWFGGNCWGLGLVRLSSAMTVQPFVRPLCVCVSCVVCSVIVVYVPMKYGGFSLDESWCMIVKMRKMNKKDMEMYAKVKVCKSLKQHSSVIVPHFGRLVTNTWVSQCRERWIGRCQAVKRGQAGLRYDGLIPRVSGSEATIAAGVSSADFFQRGGILRNS